MYGNLHFFWAIVFGFLQPHQPKPRFYDERLPAQFPVVGGGAFVGEDATAETPRWHWHGEDMVMDQNLPLLDMTGGRTSRTTSHIQLCL